MKILLIGDTQIANHKAMGGPMTGGLNVRCQEILEALEYQVGYARANFGIEAVVQVGDFFDLARPSAALYTAVIELIKRHPVEWHILAGNHDIASYDAPTAIAPLVHLANVHVYERPTVVKLGEVLWAMVPYVGPSCAEAIERMYAELNGRHPRFWVCHYGFVDKSEVPRTDLFDLKYDKLSRDFQAWFFGHEHGSRASRWQNWRSYRSLGSFCDYDFGSGCTTKHASCVLDTHAPDAVATYALVTPTPVFLDFTKCKDSEEFRTLLDSIIRRASAVYGRVRPEQVEQAEFYKRAGMMRDIIVLPTAIEALQVAETDASGTFMDCVAEEITSAELEPEGIATLWSLCDRYMREESKV